MVKCKILVGNMTRRLPDLTEALEGLGQDNVYVRRKLAEGPISVSTASRLVQRASQYGISDALGYLWQMERTMAKVLPIVRDMQATINDTIEKGGERPVLSAEDAVEPMPYVIAEIARRLKDPPV